ncbi:MAG: DUF2007 domain-containing protein [Muribaculaceae bacterium]|nr:DUF2007 domain-containing protein [Muribaculaceae bacterium]MDE6332502.1 DUF2007 domain-containing protein [Muribaculaceae bacterium]
MDTVYTGWVVVNTYSHDWEARIAKGVLDQAGIPAVIQNETFSSIYPVGFNSIGGLPLLVPAEMATRAKKLLGL